MYDSEERPPIAQSPLSILLPTFNDEASVVEVVRGWSNYLAGLQRDHEVIVIDDGSTDQTVTLVEAAAGPQLRLLRHAEHQGLGAALRTGIAAARHSLLLYTDCDSLYEPSDLKALLDVIDPIDIAAGFRVRAATKSRRGWGRWFYDRMVRFIFGVRLRDVDCMFKLFRRSVFARIPIQSKGGFVHAEILAKANFLGCLMTEVALPERTRTRPAPQLEAFELKERLRAANFVFHHPDFGPAVLPSESVAVVPPSDRPVPA